MSAIFGILFYGFFVNFWMAAILYGLTAIVCGGVSPPLLAMMSNTAPKGTQGSSIGLWIIVSSVSYLISVQVLAIFLPQGSSLGHIQKVLAINSSIPAFLSAFCFYMSSYDYARIMSIVNKERSEAVAKAIEIAPEMLELNARHTI